MSQFHLGVSPGEGTPWSGARLAVCGRYSLTETTDLDLRFLAETVESGWLAPRYNIAPGQAIPVVTREERRQVEPMRWGLIPVWADDPKRIKNTINARDDKLTSSGLWKRPLQRSRCLIPADGYYEWMGPKGARRPMYVRMKTGEVFAFAGLYDVWKGPGGHIRRTCAIITTEPNATVAPIHSRMPAILDRSAEGAWIDPKVTDPGELFPLLKPYPADALEAVPVSPAVNSPAVDSPECIQPLKTLL